MKRPLNDGERYYYSAEEVENIDQTLFNRLYLEQKACQNWKKLLMRIQIVKALSVRKDVLQVNSEDHGTN